MLYEYTRTLHTIPPTQRYRLLFFAVFVCATRTLLCTYYSYHIVCMYMICYDRTITFPLAFFFSQQNRKNKMINVTQKQEGILKKLKFWEMGWTSRIKLLIGSEWLLWFLHRAFCGGKGEALNLDT